MNWISANENALDILGKLRNRRVLVSLESESLRFSDMMHGLRVNPRSLSAALKELIAASLVEKVEVYGDGVGKVYRLTSAGADLVSGRFLKDG